jgi:hypothetical protein
MNHSSPEIESTQTPPGAGPAPLQGAKFATPQELGLEFGAWEIFQHPRFVDVYASYFGWTVMVEHGVVIFARRVPGLGLLRAQAYAPEAGGGADWHRILGDLPAGRIEVMTNAPVPASVAMAVSPPDLHSFLIDLRAGAGGLFERLDTRTRKAIRKGERENLTVRATSDPRDLAGFHEVLWRVTEGGVVYDAPDAGLLLAIMRAGFARLYVIEHGGKIVGGLTLLVNRYSHGYVSAFDRHACNGLPGHLLYWKAIEGEIEAGMPFLDLGAQRLSAHPGITKVKLGFSPALVPAYRYELALSRWRASIGDAWRWIKRPRATAPPVPTTATEVTD